MIHGPEVCSTPRNRKRRKLSETYRNGSSLGSLLLRRSRCNFINLCRQRHLGLRHRRVVQATQENIVVYAAHGKEKENVTSIRSRIYLWMAKQCQGMSE